eukprot:CAMPEP_0115849900 /NCGR_PEP_ID=MMETSP0287-20121206/11688_1 /TAXON_ID=412157 /ORGANISM="Chrysochromulina rotalis, Strain UIO044" /LENGTH=69 /DNA_ID=CAMNT_0003303883 /DNA_START=669 /DNA_END=876 /DNA_ORIENTATION=+
MKGFLFACSSDFVKRLKGLVLCVPFDFCCGGAAPGDAACAATSPSATSSESSESTTAASLRTDASSATA